MANDRERGLRIRVSADICIASGECARSVPEVFGQHEDGTVELHAERPAPALSARVLQAASQCPSRAIEID